MRALQLGKVSVAAPGLMKFTLVFDGDLPSSGNSSHKKAIKWAIRKQFHPQFEELWRTHPALVHLRENGDHVIPKNSFFIYTRHHSVPAQNFDAPKETIDLCAPIKVGAYEFLPLVRDTFLTTCSLDILFLRRENPGQILQSGDIDNRIKTLFDALKVPDKDELVDDPTIDGPVHCLMESDGLITACHIKTERLLARPNSPIHDAQLVVEVTVETSRPTLYFSPLLRFLPS